MHIITLIFEQGRQPFQPQVNTVFQSPAAYNMQGSQSNPCSGFVSFVVNIPAYIFGGATGTQLSAINLTVQPETVNQQTSATDQARNTRQVNVTATSGTEQNPARSEWQQVETMLFFSILCLYYNAIELEYVVNGNHEVW